MAQSYGSYKKGVKKHGGKQIATRKEFAIIQKRMKVKYGKTARTSSIEKALKRSGLSASEIARLRGK